MASLIRYERCAVHRRSRLEAYRNCDLLQRQARKLYEAICRTRCYPEMGAESAQAAGGDSAGSGTAEAVARSISAGGSEGGDAEGRRSSCNHHGLRGGSAARRPWRHATAGSLQRASFLDLYLSLVRENVLNANAVGEDMATFPFCFAPPRYVRYLDGHWPERWSADRAAEDMGGTGGAGADYSASYEERAAVASISIADPIIRWSPGATKALMPRYGLGLRAWDDGVMLWHILRGCGRVNEHGQLPLDSFVDVTFEMTDAIVTHAFGAAHVEAAWRATPNQAPHPPIYAPLQAYVNALERILNAVLVAPRPARARAAPSPGVVSPWPPPRPAPPPLPMLRHAWPAYDSPLAKAVAERKVAVLLAAMKANVSLLEKALDKTTASDEFLKFRSALDQDGGKLSFCQFDLALQAMTPVSSDERRWTAEERNSGDYYYHKLVFPFALSHYLQKQAAEKAERERVERERIAKEKAEAKAEAREAAARACPFSPSGDAPPRLTDERQKAEAEAAAEAKLAQERAEAEAATEAWRMAREKTEDEETDEALAQAEKIMLSKHRFALHHFLERLEQVVWVRWRDACRQWKHERLVLQAKHDDTDEMLCFFRVLDRDGDGLISKSDFCHSVLEAMGDRAIWSGAYHKKFVALKGLRLVQQAKERWLAPH